MAAPRTASPRRPPELRRPRLLPPLLPLLLLLLPLSAPSRGEPGLRSQARGADPGTPRGPALGARAGETRRDSALRAQGEPLWQGYLWLEGLRGDRISGEGSRGLGLSSGWTLILDGGARSAAKRELGRQACVGDQKKQAIGKRADESQPTRAS